jgi:hypothetical protein
VTTTEADLILRAITDLRSDIADVKTEVVEVKAEARKTNGRLRHLELWRAGLEAVNRAHSWVRPAAVAFVSGVAVAVVGAVIAAVLNGN